MLVFMPIVGTLFVVLFVQSYNISATLPPLPLRLFAQNRQIAWEKHANHFAKACRLHGNRMQIAMLKHEFLYGLAVRWPDYRQ